MAEDMLFLTNVPSPYRVDFFNELGKQCDLTVLFEKTTSDERDNSWRNYKFENFKGIFLKGFSLNADTALSFEVIKYVKDRKFDKIICTNVASPTGMIAIQYMKQHKIPYFIEGDGGFAKSGYGFKEHIKKHFIGGAKGYFSTSAVHDDYYVTYGAPKEKIYRYPFTSLKSNDIAKTVISEEEKIKIRNELKIKEKQIVLAVGQFIHRKGFDVLLNAVEKLPKNIGFYFVGGKPTEEYLKIRNEKNLTNIHFVGFKNKSELKKYYMAADLFVHPTREDIWGLVINEAMAHGLPIITTNRCIAGLELVEDNVNGFVIDVDNVDMLSARIVEILMHKDIKELGENSLSKISEYTIEKMAEKHIDILNRL